MTGVVMGMVPFVLCVIAVVVLVVFVNWSRRNSEGNAHMDEIRIEIMKQLAENIKEARTQRQELEQCCSTWNS